MPLTKINAMTSALRFPSFFVHCGQNFFSCRPLHVAARKGLATVVQVLLSRGAAVMAVDEEGNFLFSNGGEKNKIPMTHVPYANDR